MSFSYPSLVLILFPLVIGCGSQTPEPTIVARSNAIRLQSDPDQVQQADISILFIGNSHTSFHDLPHVVEKMIQFRQPEKKVYVHSLGVGFLEEVAHQPQFREEMESRTWKFVVLQAQKISMSGKFKYSQTEGIEFAKLAKSKGAKVFFFSEWGRKDVKDEGPRTERIYQEMANTSDTKVSPIGRAWDIALAQRPELELHDADGNHQSQLGAFLTACVLYGSITGESPEPLGSFSCFDIGEKDRQFLAECAAKAIFQKSKEEKQ
jgi:hypothetical protein